MIAKIILVFIFIIIFLCFIYYTSIIKNELYELKQQNKYILDELNKNKNKNKIVEGFAASTPLDDLAAINTLAQIARDMNKDSGYTFPSNAEVKGTLKVKGRDILEELDAIKAKTNNITGDVNGISKLLFTGDVIMYQNNGICVGNNKIDSNTYIHLYIDGASNIRIFTYVKGALGLDFEHHGNINYLACNDITGRNLVKSDTNITAIGNITATNITATGTINATSDIIAGGNIKAGNELYYNRHHISYNDEYDLFVVDSKGIAWR
jgi:hypothetical protein